MTVGGDVAVGRRLDWAVAISDGCEMTVGWAVAYVHASVYASFEISISISSISILEKEDN